MEDAAADELIRGWQRQALIAEDKPMVEAIEKLWPVVQRHGMTPTMLKCDEAAVRVTREIDRLESLDGHRSTIAA